MDVNEKLNYTEICMNAMPGFSCHLYELVALGFLYILCGLSCFYFLYKIYRYKKGQKGSDLIERQAIVYWISMIIFLFYRGILWLCYFPYTRKTFNVFHSGLPSIFFIIPFSILILIICEILFLSFNPGKSVVMLEIILYVFLITFVIVGFFFSFFLNTENTKPLDSDSTDEEFPLFIWTCCTNLIIVIFTTVPAVELIRSYSFPFAQEEDKNCINLSKFGVVSFALIMSLRLLYNFLQFINQNPITKWYNKGHFRQDQTPGTRIFTFFYSFIFDLLPIVISNSAIDMLYKRHVSSSREPYALA